MEKLLLNKISSVEGEVLLPGSKSLSNRILLLAAMAEGTTKVVNLLDSDDTRYMLGALVKLGIKLNKISSTEIEVTGLGSAFDAGTQEMFLGNAGTAMRPLAAALCVSQGEYILTGEERMYERPIGDLIESLQALGADVKYLGTEGYPPLKIKGATLTSKKISIRGNLSSQFTTALLMSAPLIKGGLEIEIEGEMVSKPYIDITLAVMKNFGVVVTNNNYKSFSIPEDKYVSPGEAFVEGDASSASYFLAAAAISGKCKVIGAGSESVQGDVKFADILEQMGAKVTWGANWIEVEKADKLVGVDVDLNHIPDAAMTIATAALFAKGTTAIRNVYNWRLKETDRLNAMATELRKVGAIVNEGEDFIEITPPAHVNHAEIGTYNDHRMAMCFSLVSFGCEVTILDPKCTAKTFPTYFSVFDSVAKA
jgi:3-phosphoshikimate 1-carboxyvinyltransferase